MSLFDQFQESVESLQSSAVAQEQPIIGRPVAVLEREDLQQPRHLQQEAMFALDPVQYQFPQIRDIVVSCVDTFVAFAVWQSDKAVL